MTDHTELNPQSSAVPLNIAELRDGHSQIQGESLLTLGIRRLRRDYLTLAALSVLVTLCVLSLGAPVISEALGVNYRSTNIDKAFLDIGAQGHVLGTDDLGRDHLSRLLYAGRVSLGLGISAALLSSTIGVSLGLITGFYQGGRLGFVDDFMTWFITTLNSVPFLFLLLIISAMLRPSVFTLIFILSILSWTFTMRLVRGETLSQRERDYVLAARALGSRDHRIMVQHILPNIFSVIIINMMIVVGDLILTESALSFLNLGVRPPTPSWGNMLTNAQSFFTKGFHLVVMPGTLIAVTVLCLYLVGDGLRDAFDPRAVRKS